MNEEFESEVTRLEQNLKETTLLRRNRKVNILCERFVRKYNKLPESYQLTLLANIILQDELSNPDVYKVQNTEYPVLSIPQEKRRSRREFSAKDSTLDFMTHKVRENISTSPPLDNR